MCDGKSHELKKTNSATKLGILKMGRQLWIIRKSIKIVDEWKRARPLTPQRLHFDRRSNQQSAARPDTIVLNDNFYFCYLCHNDIVTEMMRLTPPSEPGGGPGLGWKPQGDMETSNNEAAGWKEKIH